MLQKQKNDYSDCPQILRDYLFYLQTIKGRSSRTVDGYYIDLRTFFRFILIHRRFVSSDQPFEDISIQQVDLTVIQSITLSDIYEFLHFTASQRNNSAATRSRKVSSLKTFFHYLTAKTNQLSSDPTLELEVPGLKKSLPKYLSLEQCLSLLKSIEGDYKERDYCIITLFLNCGMRLSELVNIGVNDIKGAQIRLLGKGNKERIIYLNEACLEALQTYLTYRNSNFISPAHKNALFLTRNGTRIGSRRVEQIIDENLKRAGLDNYGFSTHKLRHTAATIMYQYGNVDIRILQQILGHSNLGTTEIYTHISNKQMEQAVKNTPLSNIRPDKMFNETKSVIKESEKEESEWNKNNKD